jgi:hypothetical protein
MIAMPSKEFLNLQLIAATKHEAEIRLCKNDGFWGGFQALITSEDGVRLNGLDNNKVL